MKDEKRILSTITEIYIIFLLIFFPILINQNGYEKILEIKYCSYISITVIYLVINILVFLYFLIVKKINYFKNYKFNKIHFFVLIFLIVNIIATILSPYKNYNLIKGLGRGEGLLNVILYVSMFVNISVFGEFKKRYLLYFSISNIIVSGIGLLQYLGLNPLNLYKELSGPYNMSYISTIGNIDFMSAYYTIMLTVSTLSFIFVKDKKKKSWVHLLSMILGITIFLLIDVDSGKVAFLFVTMLIVPYILKSSEFLYKFLISLAVVVFGYFLVYFLNMSYFYSNFTYKPILNINLISFILMLTIIFLLITSYYIYKNKYEMKSIKKVRKYVYISYIFIGILGILVLYLYPFKTGILYQVHEMLHGNFDDTFGTYRIFLWKRSLNLIPSYPIFGTGPDTFAMRFMSNYYIDLIKLDGYITINDNAANVYLTMLVNIGIAGLLSYLLIVCNIIKRCIKSNSKYIFIFFIAFVCFLVQDFFNLTVVIITPIYYLLMAILTMKDN